VEPLDLTSLKVGLGSIVATRTKAQRFTAFKKQFPGARIEQMKGNFRDMVMAEASAEPTGSLLALYIEAKTPVSN
jgi:hypothetical protein